MRLRRSAEMAIANLSGLASIFTGGSVMVVWVWFFSNTHKQSYVQKWLVHIVTFLEFASQIGFDRKVSC